MGETKDARALIEAVPTSSLASKLRTLMPAIGRRIGAGVHAQDIVGALNDSGAFGTEVKLTTLRTYLQRYRAAQRTPVQ